MGAARLTLTALAGMPLVAPGDDLAGLFAAALRRMDIAPEDDDLLVVAQKVVSKAEGRFVDLAGVVASPRAAALAEEVNKDPRLVEVILSESDEVVRPSQDVLIVAASARVRHGQRGRRPVECRRRRQRACAVAAARSGRLGRGLEGKDRRGIRRRFGIVINDSFGRAWRNGVVGVAIGSAGVPRCATSSACQTCSGAKCG